MVRCRFACQLLKGYKVNGVFKSGGWVGGDGGHATEQQQLQKRLDVAPYGTCPPSSSTVLHVMMFVMKPCRVPSGVD